MYRTEQCDHSFDDTINVSHEAKVREGLGRFTRKLAMYISLFMNGVLMMTSYRD